MRWVLRIIGGVIAAVLLGGMALAVWILTLDINDYKAPLQRLLRDASGAEITLGGDLELTLSTHPVVVAHDVHVVHSPDGTQRVQLDTLRFEMHLALWPLLQQQVQIDAIKADGVRVDVAMHVPKKDQVTLSKPARPEKSDAHSGGSVAGNKAEADTSLPPLSLHVQQVALGDVQLRYHDHRSGEKHALRLGHARVHMKDTTPVLDIAGSYQGHAFVAQGTVGTLEEILAAQRLPVDLTLGVHEGRAKLRGSVAQLGVAPVVDLKVDTTGKSLQEWGAQLPLIAPYRLNATVKSDGTRYRITPLAAVLGDMHVAGNVTVHTAASRPKIVADLRAPKLVVDTLMQAVKAPSEGKVETLAHQQAGAATSKNTNMAIATPQEAHWPLQWLHYVDADITWHIEELQKAALVAQAVQGKAVLNNKILQIKDIRAQLAGGTLDGAATLNARNIPPMLEVKADAQNVNAGQVLQALQQQQRQQRNWLALDD